MPIPEIRTLRQWYGITAPKDIHPRRTALILVDFQEEFFGGKLPVPEGPRAVTKAAELLHWARREGLLVAHVRHVAAQADSPLFAPHGDGIAIRPEVSPLPEELVLTKTMAGGFTGTDLAQRCKDRGIQVIIVCGLMTHLAVDTTVRDGSILGFRVIVPADATATRDLPGVLGRPAIDQGMLHSAVLSALNDRFADVMSTKDLLALPINR